jgi:uncharacterized protein YgiM (DUF1202 family)
MGYGSLLMHRAFRHTSVLLSGTAVMGMVLSGCAGGGGGGGVFGNNLNKYANTSDSCYYARKPLIDTGDVFSQSMITGAAVGGVAGAGVGAAADSSHPGQGALIGGLVGAATGAFAGYLAAKQKQAANRQELLASIDADASRDNRQLVTSSNAIASLTHCRQEQVAKVMREYREKRITAADAKAQLVTIRGNIHDDNALIADVLGEASDRSTTYVKARADAGGISESSSSSRPAAQPGQYVATANANIRQGPSRKDAVIGHLASGEPVDVGEDAGNGWVSVTHDGVTGYVSKSVLSTGASSPRVASSSSAKQTASSGGGTGGTAEFAKTNEQAAQRGQEHKAEESDVQTKINDLSAIVG